MKTPIKPAINFKRASLISLFLMFVIIGIQSQKSLNYSFYYDADSFKKALLKKIELDDKGCRGSGPGHILIHDIDLIKSKFCI